MTSKNGTPEFAKRKLIELVKKKLTKGCSITEIADMLEETVETIEEIVKELENKEK